MKTQSRSGALLCVFFFATTMSIFAQGSIVPSTAPSVPIMKTLDQVEARIPLSGGTTTASIDSSGSYYLTGNITTSSGMAITVNASDVAIDLNGFTISATTGTGVLIASSKTNIAIRNGTIRGCGSYAINGVGNSKVRVENVRAINNGGNGIVVDVNGEVINCIAESNVGYGILGTDNCLIKDCQVSGTTGSPGDGISVGAVSLVTGCVARGNKNGVIVGQGCTISGCNAFGNFPDGIKATSDCLILSNNSSNNGGAGIRTTGADNRIESNHVSNNISFGIVVEGTANLIIRNTSRGSASAYNIAANNKVGVLVLPPNSPAIPGGTAAGVGTTDPWANFLY